MKTQKKSKSASCPFCTPSNPDNSCVLANAKTVIDGVEYSACCSNPNPAKPKKSKGVEKKAKIKK